MNKKRPLVITIASICLVLLVLVSAGQALTGNFGFTGSFADRDRIALDSEGLVFRGGTGAIPQGDITGQLPEGVQPGSRLGIQGGRGSGGNTSILRPLMQSIRSSGGDASSLLGIFRTVIMGLKILVLILGLLAAIGLWKQKKWAAILAILLAIGLLLTNISGLTRIFIPVLFGLSLLKVILAAAVIVLLLLPAARKAYAPPKDLDLLEGLE